MRILIIPDSHAHPKYDNERFDLLGEYILDTRPDVIIDIGDGPDMPSLSSYDRGKKSFEGRRYHDDLEAYTDAQKRLTGPMRDYNKRRRKNKEKQYKPKMYKLGGNHDEGRINKYVQDNPEWEGMISIEDLTHEKWGWEYIPFRENLIIEGIAFSHYFPSGTMGKPIGGENQAASQIRKNLMSSVAGHSHIFDHAERTRADGNKIFGLSVGCFVHWDYMKEGWCKDTSRMWWNGLVTLDGVEDGYYRRLETITLTELETRYR